jgi:hypothetical protein
MDEKEPPITDKENFPPSENAAKQAPLLIDMSSIAYYDGLAEGYRKAVRDFLMFFILFSIIGLTLRFRAEV